MTQPRKRPRPGREPWRDLYVLARIDPDGPFAPGNCEWRLARTEREARFGVEEGPIDEPDVIPLTDEQREQRESLPSEKEREMFDIWARLVYRSNRSQATPNN